MRGDEPCDAGEGATANRENERIVRLAVRRCVRPTCGGDAPVGAHVRSILLVTECFGQQLLMRRDSRSIVWLVLRSSGGLGPSTCRCGKDQGAKREIVVCGGAGSSRDAKGLSPNGERGRTRISYTQRHFASYFFRHLRARPRSHKREPRQRLSRKKRSSRLETRVGWRHLGHCRMDNVHGYGQHQNSSTGFGWPPSLFRCTEAPLQGTRRARLLSWLLSYLVSLHLSLFLSSLHAPRRLRAVPVNASSYFVIELVNDHLSRLRSAQPSSPLNR